jgi:formylglycine-generating enzyme required for sulfatase activity
MNTCPLCGTETTDADGSCPTCGPSQDATSASAPSHQAQVGGSGAVAQDHSVAAGERGVAIGGDVIKSTIVTGSHNTVTVVYQGDEVDVPSLEAVQRHRAALREQLAADAQKRWGGMSAYIQEEGATLPIQASPYQAGQLGPRENLLQTLHASDRLLVLGEPGTGKTVALERLAWELCDGPEPIVPVMVRLFQYAGRELTEWIRAFLQRTGQLRLADDRTLNAFLQESPARFYFLLDGLNEVPPPYRDRLVSELVRWIAAYPRHSVILTSRSQDELWRRLRDDVGRAVLVQPISDEQARAYLSAHLDERVEQLYGQLDDRLRELARTPLFLWLIKEAGAAEEDLPGNRGELYARFVSRMLKRDTDRRMDADIAVRLKQDTLANLAYHLGLDQRLSCDRDEAVEIAAQRLDRDLMQAEQVIGACARHGLLAGEDEVWFSPHQTTQEHFAALQLLTLVENERLLSDWQRWGRAARKLFAGKDEGLTALAADDWWMETFVQLAGLTEDVDWLVREVAKANPWLAWWCVQEGRDVQDETREMVANQSVKMLKSERVRDRRRGVSALARARNERAIEPLLRAAGDSDSEAAGLATQGLVELGEAARPRITETLTSTNPKERAIAGDVLAKLGDPRPGVGVDPETGLPDIILCLVPAGPFSMGSSDDDEMAFDDEKPQHELDLQAFKIAKYPVTNAQYRAFVAAGGYDQPSYWTEAGWERKEWTGPRDFDEPFNAPNHPVVGVSWFEAVAYCAWLTEVWRSKGKITEDEVVRLPSEPQFEKAARGTDGRVFPWGDEFDASKCNVGETEINATSAVGIFPAGASPCGVLDMSGNVLEWCATRWQEEHPLLQENEWTTDYLGGGADRVVRGGSWGYDLWFARCASRGRSNPFGRLIINGFRIVVASTSSRGDIEHSAAEGSALDED